MSRSHCRLCDRPIHYVARRFVWVHDTRGADHGPIPGPVVQPAPATLSEVWCEKCPDPATTEVRITDGTAEWTSARCALHAGALVNAARVADDAIAAALSPNPPFGSVTRAIELNKARLDAGLKGEPR